MTEKRGAVEVILSAYSKTSDFKIAKYIVISLFSEINGN